MLDKKNITVLQSIKIRKGAVIMQTIIQCVQLNRDDDKQRL